MPMTEISIKDKKIFRKYSVFVQIVRTYISKAVPVSSKSVAQNMDGDVSSATVRNIMAELENEGFIAQPHISAGRVPTNTGYRLYVDMVKGKIIAEREQSRRLAFEYSRRIKTIREVIKKTSFLLSREMHNAGVVLWPSVDDFYLKHLELIKIKPETVLAVLVTMTNAVENYIVKLDREIDKTELTKITNYINGNFEHLEFSEIPKRIKVRLKQKKQGNEDRVIAESALELISLIIEKDGEEKKRWEGIDYFIDEPEFTDVETTKKVLKLFSERDELAMLMKSELPSMDLNVYIGEENQYDILQNCSVVTGGYRMHGKTVGRIGIIGPTRMDYLRALQTVRCLSDLVSLKLSELND